MALLPPKLPGPKGTKGTIFSVSVFVNEENAVRRAGKDTSYWYLWCTNRSFALGHRSYVLLVLTTRSIDNYVDIGREGSRARNEIEDDASVSTK